MLEDYRREMDKIGPSDAQLARLKTALSARRETRRRPLRAALIAAATCAALAVSVVAASPDLRARLADLLGAFAPYAQKVEGVTAIDQGIQIQVVSALADETEGWVYLAVTDLTGDRLDASTDLDGLNYVDGGLQSYDPETKTALFKQRIYMGSRDEAGKLTLQINRVTPNVVRICPEEQRVDGVVYEDPVDLPTELICSAPLQSFELTSNDMVETSRDLGRTVLIPGQTPADLGSEYLSLSSMGLDENGDFHIQVALEEKILTEDMSLFVESASAVLTNGERVEFTSTQSVVFGDGTYCDITLCLVDSEWKIDPERIDELELGGLIGVLAVEEPIQGDWTLTFEVETVPERTIRAAETVNGMTVERITCAVTSITIEGTSGGGTPANVPLAVYLKDGTVMTVDRGIPTDVYQKKDGGSFGYSAMWRLESPIEPEQVTAISFGYWYVPLKADGTAGEGHWLSELPE